MLLHRRNIYYFLKIRLIFKHTDLTKPEKCEFDTIGHNKYVKEQVEISDAKPKKVNVMKKGEKKKQGRLWLSKFEHNFIPGFSDKAKLLTDSTRHSLANKVKWNDEAEESYLALTASLIEKPFLHLHDEISLLCSELMLVKQVRVLHCCRRKIFLMSYASRQLKILFNNRKTMRSGCLADNFLCLYGNELVKQTDSDS